MFTDLEGYTGLAQANEAEALRLLEEQEGLLLPLVEAYHGERIKSTGDGFLLAFDSAREAAECGYEIQRKLHERNTRTDVAPIRVRIGIHVGDVERRGVDIFGDAVNIAARIEPVAEPGGICISEPTYFQVRGKVAFPFEKLGPRELKGLREPLELYRAIFPWSIERRNQAPPSHPRIAVLPLASISPELRDEYFADGLTEELISVLSQIAGLRVIARTSINQFKGTTKSVRQIGAELGVNSILEGSVRKSGPELRISLQLVDVGTQEPRWAHSYDRRLENVFAIQADVAEQTAAALKVELLKGEREALAEKPTTSLAAYDFYLRGISIARRYLDSPTDRRADEETVKLFEAAIREDPRYSDAHSRLADHLINTIGEIRKSDDVSHRARELIDRATGLNPNSSDAHAAHANLALQVDRDWETAEYELRTAIRLNPSSSLARFTYTNLLSILQRFDEAKQMIDSAIELDPLWVALRAECVTIYSRSGKLEMALVACQEIAAGTSCPTWILPEIPILLAIMGRYDEARRAMDRLIVDGSASNRRSHAVVKCWLGEPDELLSYLKDWEEGRFVEFADPLMTARAYALVGERNKALSLIEQDFAAGDRLLWWSYQGFAFDPIREDPRFVRILQEMNLPITVSRPLVVPGAKAGS